MTTEKLKQKYGVGFTTVFDIAGNRIDISERIAKAYSDGTTEATKELQTQLAISEHDREHNDYELTEAYKKIADLEKQIEKMRNSLRGIVYMADSGLHTKNELAFYRLIAEAKDLVKE